MDYINYLLLLVSDFPIVCGVTIVVYTAFYFLYGRRRKDITRGKIAAEFILLGWFFMYLYVTQFMSLGNGLGARINLVPFQTFRIAIRYGVTNAGMLKQIVLNAVMVMPLGFLLPIVFPKRFNKIEVIAGISFAITLLTETIQYFTLRGTDIDDIIANTAGGLLGFGLYVVVIGLLSIIRRKPCNQYMKKGRYAGNLIVSALMFIISICPFAIVNLADAGSEYGSVYYGHNQPTHVEIPETISDQETMAIVYKRIYPESTTELQHRLLEATGFSGVFQSNELSDDSHHIVIYSDGTWRVSYFYKETVKSDPARLPTEEEAITFAYQYAEQFGVDTTTLTFDKFDAGYTDNNLHVILASTAQTNDTIIWGTVDITLGENGTLIEISDNRIYGEFYREVETISPKQSIEIAQDIGVGDWNGTAYVESVEPDYYFNRETGFLIPTWRTTARFVAESGNEYTWRPNIDAIK